ncbi:hypothetical protein CSO01_24440 [Cellulomonas soli]|uniref:Pyrrolo-quinoline quinone repeat domain-containing protein n=2 Tax=Cellulomonas soli TaxID=931535 RepID=A0A512PEU9_9CELL|nr:hypothetical protein CSO01_24440 [Cellulomonas soli]
MEPVELVEDDGSHGRRGPAVAPAARTPGDGAADPASPGPAIPGTRTRRLRRMALGTVAVLVVGLVATQAVVDARERSRVARFADVPGVLAPLSPDAQVLWRLDPSTEPLFATWSVPVSVGDVLLGGALDDDGTVTLGALDPDTGAELWTQQLPLPGGRQLPTSVVPGWVGCAPRSSPDPQVEASLTGTAACVVENPTAEFRLLDDDGAAQEVAVPTSTLLSIDAGTGEVIERLDLPAGTSVHPVNGGYVTLTPDVVPDPAWRSSADVPAGGVTVERHDWGSAGPRWTFHAALPAGTAFTSAAADGDGQTVTVSVAGQTWILDDADGSLREGPDGGGGYLLLLRSLPGGGVLTSWSQDGVDRTSLLTADGDTRDLVGLSALAPNPDDGSASDVVLLVEGADGAPGPIVAVDPRTGEQRWRSATVAVERSGFVLDGVVHTLVGTTLQAVDASDGSVLWQVQVPRAGGTLFTDGSVALVVAQGRLDAYDLRDGRARWSYAVATTDQGPELRPVTGGPTAAPVGTDGSSVTVDGSVYPTIVGRRLGLMDPSGQLAVLG